MASSKGIQYFSIDKFHFQNGVTLPNVKLAYREFNPPATKTVLIPTCFHGRINGTLNFVDGVFRDYRVIVVALLGNGESSSPSNTPDFPKALDYRDCVRAQHQLVTKHLGISSLDVVLGFSMGGQCAYHWTAIYPDLVKNAVIICSAARTSLHNYQFLEGPAAALENSIDYEDGAFKSKNVNPLRGLHAFGRAYSAWLTSAEWFEQRFFEKLGHKTLASWSEAGCKSYNDWDPDDLLVMLRMWQNCDLGVYSSSGLMEETLGTRIKARVLLMPCQTDQYFTWQPSEKESRLLQNAEFEAIPSIWGHIGGGGANPEDTEWMDRRIAKFLSVS